MPASQSTPLQVPNAAIVVRDRSWVFRRAMLGLAVMIVFAFGGALLLDASIDSQADAALAAQSE